VSHRTVNLRPLRLGVDHIVPQRESAREELDLIKVARHALREARSGGGNRVLCANLGLAGPPELVVTRR